MPISAVLTIVIVLVGVITGLVGIIYNAQLSKMSEIKRVQDDCPISAVNLDIQVIKTDVKWVKQKLANLKI